MYEDPGSRKYPQYGQEQLFASLKAKGISAVWREELGGQADCAQGQHQHGLAK